MSEKRKPRRKRRVVNLLHLSILESVKKEGKLPELGLSKDLMHYHVSRLRKLGLISQIGYGVWQYNEPEKKGSKSKGGTTPIKASATNPPPPIFPVEKVRGHGFQWVLKTPSHNLVKRLEAAKIPYQSLKTGFSKQAQSITFKGFKMWLFERSIRIYTPKELSYWYESAEQARIKAFDDVMQVILSLEMALKVSFKVNGVYYVKPTNQHYALYDNLLARQRVTDRQPLRVVDWDGTWLLIDCSLDVPELELVHPVRSARDADDVVVKFFNQLRNSPDMLPNELRETLKLVVLNQGVTSNNLNKLVAVVEAFINRNL